MKIVFASLLLIVGIYDAQSQTTIYDENAEIRPVPAFNSIDVSGTISLYLSQGNESGIVISAGDGNNNSRIKTEVLEGVLKISVDGGMWNTFSLANKKLKAYVSIVDLNRLIISGASYVSINGVLNSAQLEIDISGASELKGNITTQKMRLNMNGASVGRLAGSISEGLISAGGASKLNGYDLIFDKVKVSATGASILQMTANKDFVVDASGGSSIYYKGNATDGLNNLSGGASIHKKN